MNTVSSSSLKSILVHLDASPRSGERLSLAQRLARAHAAELSVLYAVIPALLGAPWSFAGDAAAAASLLAEIDSGYRDRARALHDEAQKHGASIWIEAEDGAVLPAIVRHALTADLLVLGQHDAADLRTGTLPPDLVPSSIIDSGKPTLVLPRAGAFEAAAACVLVAWKPTPQAARAVNGALPWLQGAQQVHIAASRRDADDTGRPPSDAIAHWMRLHGVKADLLPHTIDPSDAGNELLSLAVDIDAELLVMGCYGHSRAREWMLGGASRTVLESMTLPVLMAH